MKPQSARPPSFNARYGRPFKRASISLTPLIDVVFILLLFFMLASNFSNDHAIALESPASGGSPSSATGALLVNVRVNGVRVAGQLLSRKALVARVRQLRADNPDLKVLVQPGNGVDLQQTVNVLDELKTAGVRNLRLMGGPASS